MRKSLVDPFSPMKHNKDGELYDPFTLQVDDTLVFSTPSFLAKEETHSSRFISQPRQMLKGAWTEL